MWLWRLTSMIETSFSNYTGAKAIISALLKVVNRKGTQRSRGTTSFSTSYSPVSRRGTNRNVSIQFFNPSWFLD